MARRRNFTKNPSIPFEVDDEQLRAKMGAGAMPQDFRVANNTLDGRITNALTTNALATPKGFTGWNPEVEAAARGRAPAAAPVPPTAAGAAPGMSFTPPPAEGAPAAPTTPKGMLRGAMDTASSAAAKTKGFVSSGVGGTVNTAKNISGAAMQAGGTATQMLGNSGVGVLGAGLDYAVDGRHRVAAVMNNPKTSGWDVANQMGREVLSVGSGAIGGAIGATALGAAGTAIAPGAGTAAGIVAGGAGGYMAGKAAGDSFNRGLGQSPYERMQPIPMSTQNPLRVQEGAIGAPALPLGGTNPDQRVARDLPGASGESLRGQFGDFSPAGTFDNGYTDMGGGIAGKGSGARGRPNDFTNIGANGKPTAMSGMDSRTPDQIANGNRLNAETARFVAAREAAQRPDLGQQYVNNMVRSHGVNNIGDLASKSLRTAILAGGQQITSDQAGLIKAQMQDATSRSNNAETNAAQLRAAMAPKQLEMQMFERRREAVRQAITAATPVGADGKPAGEPDRTVVQQILADAGFDPQAEAQGKLVGNIQAQAEKTGKLHTDARQRIADLVSVPILDENGEPTGKADAPREKNIVSRILATRKDLANADQPTINAAVPALAAEITATDKINQGVSDQGFGFRGSFIPSYNRQEGGANTPRGPEWFKGKTLVNKGAGPWNGLGSDGTNYTLRDSGGFWGTEHDLGHLTAEEIAHIGKQIEASKQLRK